MANVVERLTRENDQRNVLSVYNGSEVLDDGYVGVIGAHAAGEDILSAIGKASDVTAEEVVMVLGIKAYLEDTYGNRVPMTDPTLITYPIDKPTRAYRLKIGDRFNVANTAINGTAVKDQFLVPANAAWLMVPAANLTGATKVAFRVVKTNGDDGQTINKGTSTEIASTLIEVVVEA